jgi:MFS family permease
MLLAGTGALVFALADSLAGLIVGRALIGLGVALALMAGFKAIVLWFPAERLALVNGWFVMLGALGAVTATAPAEFVVQMVGWRGLFAVLGALSAVAALLILYVVPDCCMPAATARRQVSLWTIYQDRRFWRLAPLSALGVGTSWSLQGLWAAPWLKDVNGLDRAGVVGVLSIMAVAVSASGLGLGIAADRLRRFAFKTEHVLAATLAASMVAQLALIFGWPIPSLIAWSVIAAAGAATVLSYAALAAYFPKEASGRANAALNIMHVGMAFLLQSITGLIIEQWTAANDRYPADAHQCAMALTLALQVCALTWFGVASRRPSPVAPRVQLMLQGLPGHSASRDMHRIETAHLTVRTSEPAGSWRIATAASVLVCIVLMACLMLASSHHGIAAHVMEVTR